MLRSSKYTFTLSLYLTEVTGGRKSMRLHRVAHDWVRAHAHTHTIWIASVVYQHLSSPSLKKVPSEKGTWRILKINQTPRNLKEKQDDIVGKWRKEPNFIEPFLNIYFPQFSAWAAPFHLFLVSNHGFSPQKWPIIVLIPSSYYNYWLWFYTDTDNNPKCICSYNICWY